MPNDKKKTYKEINGTTRVGDFLRSISKSQLFESAVKIASTGGVGVLDVLQDVLLKSNTLTELELKHSLSLLEFDLKENEEITKRHTSDMVSDSFLSKNIRPVVLIYSWILISLMIFVKTIEIDYLNIVLPLVITVNSFYFGSRAYNKYQQIKSK